jgi:hypothetical protein
VAVLEGDPVTVDTGVVGLTAVLSGRPPYWSYSALKELETCERRYVLSRASYPDLWTGRGYPAVPSAAALFGDVVHDSLEVIVRALVEAGCSTVQSREAVAVLRSLGGYSRIAERAIADRLAKLEGNPRVDADRLRRLTQALGDRLMEARGQVQEYVSRQSLPEPSLGDEHLPDNADENSSASFGRRPAGTGLHPERVLADDDLRLMGRVDLLAVSATDAAIVDYKTGAEAPAHAEQLRLYALLWDLDRVVNPARLPVRELTAAYRTHDVSVPAPDSVGLRELEADLRHRIQVADEACQRSDLAPSPDSEYCGHCPVRALCDDYWSTLGADPAAVADGEWSDLDAVVGPQNGVRSWWLQHPVTGARRVLLRTSPSAPPVAEGTRIRVLGLRRHVDPEVDAPVALLSVNSEVVRVAAGR